MDDNFRITDPARQHRIPDDVVAIVEAAQHAGVENGPVGLYRVADLVGAAHGAGHRLLDVEHRYLHACQRHREVGMQIDTVGGIGGLAFVGAGCPGAYRDHVGPFPLHHLPEVLVDGVDPPPFGESGALAGIDVATGDELEPLRGTGGRGDGVRQRAVALVVDGGPHAAEADDGDAIRGHAGVSGCREVCGDGPVSIGYGLTRIKSGDLWPRMKFRMTVTAALLVMMAALAAAQEPTLTPVEETRAWQARRNESLSDSSGWLALAGLFPLSDGQFSAPARHPLPHRRAASVA